MGNFICCRRWEIIFLGLLQAPALRFLNLSNWTLFTLESRKFSYIRDKFFFGFVVSISLFQTIYTKTNASISIYTLFRVTNEDFAKAKVIILLLAHVFFLSAD
jgi:hypothetical protein